MILFAPLADVMQEKRDIEHAPVDPLLEDGGRDRQFLDQFAPLDLGQVADTLDDMLVHRIVVIHVELHHRHDGFEFGNKGREHAQFVHASEGAFGIAVFQQEVEKELLRRRVIAHALVDQPDIGRDEQHRVGMDQEARAQRLFEQAQ